MILEKEKMKKIIQYVIFILGLLGFVYLMFDEPTNSPLKGAYMLLIIISIICGLYYAFPKLVMRSPGWLPWITGVKTEDDYSAVRRFVLSFFGVFSIMLTLIVLGLAINMPYLIVFGGVIFLIFILFSHFAQDDKVQKKRS